MGESKISLKDLVEGADSILKKNEDKLVWDKNRYQIKHQKWNVVSIEKNLKLPRSDISDSTRSCERSSFRQSSL